MANVAYTRIEHGKDDGSVVVVEEGDEVKGLPSDVVKDLKEQGLVGAPLTSSAEASEEVEELEEQNAELQARVRELEQALQEAKGPVGPAQPSGDKK